MNNQTLHIDREQAEKLADLGSYLRQLRDEQGLSLEQVADTTLIPVRTLAAIEVGNLNQLPEPVYIQGFIRRYADAIGMNGAEFAQAFPTNVKPMVAKTTWRGTVQTHLRPFHLYLLYMMLMMGAVSGLSYVLNRTSPSVVSTDIPKQNQPAAPAFPTLPYGPMNIAQSPVPTTAATQLQPILTPDGAQKSVRVGLKLTDQSWIRVVADGKTEFEGVLPEGAQRAWAADKQLVLRAGNAGGVMVSLNDGQAKRLGEPGTVEEVTFGSNSPAAAANSSTDFSTLTASTSRTF